MPNNVVPFPGAEGEETLEQKLPRFKKYLDFIQPHNLAQVFANATKREADAYQSFISYASNAESNVDLFINPADTNKTERARKTLDTYLSHLLKEFAPNVHRHLKQEHFENPEQYSSHLKQLIEQYLGIEAQQLFQVQAVMGQGGDLLPLLAPIRQFILNKDEGYVAHKRSERFRTYVAPEDTAHFMEYFKTTPHFGQYEDKTNRLNILTYREAERVSSQLVAASTAPTGLERLLDQYKITRKSQQLQQAA